ncbi:hypothetical protein K458DRAFT_413525 [Lentithecium fluviatile CBS 122367]|uniref:Uncharacterized protein n=1 Tax=Lentithecium fluviatile CBS 122367 TaxID=1168545 RepID=A0A6G1JGH3_9PLEO|nr:hypothetical protein K458DRAFT_413525 [Lentithecium fluviatile CBS 122367]
MSTPQPPLLTPEERLALEQKARYDRLTRNLAIGGAVLCPVIALMPPRKLDLYTFSLGIGFYLSADHLAQQYNGRSLFQQIRWSSPVKELPTEKAKETSRILKKREEAERARRDALSGNAGQKEGRPWWNKVWMGEEEEGWKERRLKEEKRALEEGKTYTTIILDQIWEVWSWEKKKGGKENEGETREKKE